MDLRQMRYFVTVAEELHFGKAAQRLNIAQPPLSQTILRLEKELGVELFDRSRRSVTLTDAGRVLLVEARTTLRQAELAWKLTQREGAKAPEIRVSFIGPALYRVLPQLLVRYRQVAPNVNVRLIEASSLVQVNGLLDGDFDVGFITAVTQASEDCEMMLVERAPYVAAVPADWPLAKQAKVTLAELAEQPFIRPPQKYAAQSSETLGMFKSIGLMPVVTQEATQTNTSLSLVAAGLGCSLVTATATLSQPRNVTFLPIADAMPEIHWELMMAWVPKHIGKLAEEFLSVAQEYVQDNLDPVELWAAFT